MAMVLYEQIMEQMYDYYSDYSDIQQEGCDGDLGKAHWSVDWGQPLLWASSFTNHCYCPGNCEGNFSTSSLWTTEETSMEDYYRISTERILEK